MTAAEWAALYTNPGAIEHELDGAELEVIIKAAQDDAVLRFRGMDELYQGNAVEGFRKRLVERLHQRLANPVLSVDAYEAVSKDIEIIEGFKP